MTNSVWAVDGLSESGKVGRQTSVAPWTVLGSSARPVGGRGGVRFGSGAVATVTSTTWTVKPHVGVMDAQTDATAGPYAYSVDANVTGSITAAGGSARTDALWVRVDDPAVGDGSSAPALVVGYTANTSSAPARSMLLGTISVPATGGGSPTFTATHNWLPSAIVPVRTQAERDALPLVDGMYVDRLDLNTIQRCDGTTWSNVVDCFTGSEVVRWGPAAGSNPPAGQPKRTVATSVALTTTAGGAVAVPVAGLSNIVSMVATPGDVASGLDRVTQNFANSSNTGWWGICKDVNGNAISSAIVRVNVIAVGY